MHVVDGSLETPLPHDRLFDLAHFAHERLLLMNALHVVGALLFLIWGILHIWVTYDGWEQWANGGAPAQLNALSGGAKVPKGSIKVSDKTSQYALSSLVLNFVNDVGGYGVLGFYVAYKIFTQASWEAYFLGFFIIGIADLSFLFLMVIPAEVIELSFPVLLGPAIWFIAILITPLGLPYGQKAKKN